MPEENKNIAFLLLGSNIGDRKLSLEASRRYINNGAGIIIRQSGVYETAAWGNENQPAFLNQVICIETKLLPEELSQWILETERKMGRERQGKWSERLIDIDILFYNNDIISKEGLVIPHPLLQSRKFTLVPLAEVAGTYMHPIIGKTVNQILQDCEDTLDVELVV